ncbi:MULTISPECIES: tyrosine-type recombinase/integrase [unclassified Luteococcus]|uniref:tyrosine-type recombinase/integrase n=1 Tax=unclassified Luteococcus TaxID=2639923 RepID=UPI00313ABAC3
MQLYDRSKEAGWSPNQKRWLVRWRDGDCRQRKQAFAYKTEATGFMEQLAGKTKLRDQNRTVEDQWKTWRAIRNTRSPGHQANLDSTWALHVEPEWGAVRLTDLRHSVVAEWATQLEIDQSPGVASRSLDMLSSLCAIAIRDNVIDRNPCDDISVTMPEGREQIILTREQLDQVADAMNPYSLAIRTLGLTGMRWGELAGLQVRDLDVKRRRIHIRRHVTEVGGVLDTVEGTKTGPRRTITAPKTLLDELAEKAKGRMPTDPLVPATRGGTLRHSAVYRHWRKHVNAKPAPPKPKGKTGPQKVGGLGLDVHIHDLRHTAASLLIQAGADVKVLQRQLGHKSATLTLDLYGHLMEDSMDGLSDAMDRLSPAEPA